MEDGALPLVALDLDRRIVRLQDALHDGEAEADAALGACARGIGTSEALEDLRECAFGDTLPAVCDLDDDVSGRGA